MSFWSDLGDKAKKGVIGAWNAAQSGADLITKYVPAAHAGVSISNAIQKPIIWTAEQASHGIAASWAAGDIAQQNGSLASQFTPSVWKQAWDQTGDAQGGAVAFRAVQSAVQGNNDFHVVGAPTQMQDASGATSTTYLTPDYREWQQSTAGRILGGATDILLTWYADPTIVVGKAAKLSRAANTIEDAAKAEDVSKAFDAKGLAADPATKSATARGTAFSRSTNETATRLSATIAHTDGMDTNQIAAAMKPLLERSYNAAPIVDLLGQAGKVTDLTLQRQIKADVLLAAAGSLTARQRLIESAPDIARAMQRVSNAPEEFARLDELAKTADTLYARGDSLTAAARAIGAGGGNKKEIVQYGKTLDRLHRHMRDVTAEAEMGGLERVGLTALDRWKASARSNIAQEFYYQGMSGGKTIRMMHWPTSQRSRGIIATDDAFRGHEELMDHLTRSGLYEGAERAKISEKWWKANGQGFRNAQVDKLWDDMVSRAAAKEGMTAAEAKDISRQIAEKRAAGRKYATAQMEQARVDGASRVTIEDPVTGTATQIDRALFESHVRNNVALPDTDLIQRTIRQFKDSKTVGDRLRLGYDHVTDATSAMNDWWRLAVLARPGLFVRTQLDTQARAVAMMGVTGVLANTLKGMGHKLASGVPMAREELVKVGARAQDTLERERLLAEAADLRRKADLVGSNPAAQRMLDRATEMEAHANRPVEYDAANNYLGAKDAKVKVAGTTQTTRAYQSYDDMLATWDNLLPGDATMGDLFTGLSGKQYGKFIENADNWKTYAPDDRRWGEGWRRATDSIRTSHTGRKVMSLADVENVDLVKALREDHRVKKEWLDVKFDNPRFDDWLDRVIHQVSWYAPHAAARQALLSGKRVDDATLEKLFAGRGQSTKATWQVARDKAGRETVKAKRELLAHMNKRASSDPEALAKRAEKQKRLEDKLAKAKARVDALEANPPAVDPNVADRMFVHSPELEQVFGRAAGTAMYTPAEIARRFIRFVSDKPDIVLARHPVYVNRYMNHFSGLAKRAVERGDIDGTGKLSVEAQTRIESMARHRAIKDVQQAMYDTARYTGAHAGLMRMVSPFLNAWEDAMMSWSRLMYDDPKRLGALMKTWNMPERMGLVVDQDGNIVKPGESARQKFIAVPLGAASKFVGVKELQLRKDSWNSIFQGEVWWQPGYGPIVTVPAQEVATRAFAKDVDTAPAWAQPIIRGLLNGDAPKVRPGPGGVLQDAALGMAPSGAKKWFDAFNPGSPAFTNVFQDSVNSQVIEMRKAGHEPTKADWDKITNKAVAAAKATNIVKALALGVFGQSSEGAGIQKFYSDQYKALQAQKDAFAAEGKTVEQVFNEKFPEAAGLRWNVSVSETGITASVKTEDRAALFKKEIENPDTREYGWAYIGGDNVGGEFSPSVYNAQSSRRAGPGSTDTQRHRVSPEDMVNRTKVDLGWGEYQRIATKIDLILEQRGLRSINQKGAEDLAQIKRQFVAQLGANNPQWAKDYGSFDSTKLQRFITNWAEPALSDKRLKNRSDIKLMGQYLAYRQKAMDLAQQNGFSLASQQGAQLRSVLDQLGTEYARQDLGFGQMWQRMLSREVEG